MRLSKRAFFEDFTVIIIICLSLFSIFHFREFIIYRDFVIIWDGIQEIRNGGSFYKNIIIPLGAFTFHFTNIFSQIFGDSWYALQISQIFLNCVMLITAYLILRRHENNKYIIYAALIIFGFIYLILLNHPWYNNLAALLTLLVFYLIDYENKAIIILAGLISGFLFITKYDFGIYVFFAAYIYFFFSSNRSVTNFFKKSLLFTFAASLIISVEFMFYSQEMIDEISKLTFLNAESRSYRFSDAINFLNICKFYLFVWCLFYGCSGNRIFLIAGLIILISTLTEITGGIFYTHYYFIFMLPSMLNKIRLEHKLKKYFWINSLIVLIIILPSIRLALFSYENVLRDYPDHEYFNYRDLNTDIDIVDLGECFPELKRLLGPSQICLLKNQLDKFSKLERQIKILNLTELGFIDNQKYFEKDSPFPLWMKNGVTVSKSLETELISKVQSNYYDVVLIESVDESLSSNTFRDYLKKIAKNNLELELVTSDIQSSTCIKKQSLRNCNIHVYYDKGLISLLDEKVLQ